MTHAYLSCVTLSLKMRDSPSNKSVAATVASVLAALLGFASHAPGNLGVFDAAMLLAFPQIEKEQLLAALLIFRCLYFPIPFAVALTAFGIRELWMSAWRERA
jgi:uncharacterized membrane protein YbhN (UPF0104 family)